MELLNTGLTKHVKFSRGKSLGIQWAVGCGTTWWISGGKLKTVCDHLCAPTSIFISQKNFYLHILTLCLKTHQRRGRSVNSAVTKSQLYPTLPTAGCGGWESQSVCRVVNQSILPRAPEAILWSVAEKELWSRKAAISTAVFAQTEMAPRHLELLSLILKIRLLNTVWCLIFSFLWAANSISSLPDCQYCFDTKYMVLLLH